MSTDIARKAAATDNIWSNDWSTGIGIFSTVRNSAATHDFEHMFRLPKSEDAAGKMSGWTRSGLFSSSLVREIPVSSADLEPRVERRNRILASLIPETSVIAARDHKQNIQRLTVDLREHTRIFTKSLTAAALGAFGHAGSVEKRRPELSLSVKVDKFSITGFHPEGVCRSLPAGRAAVVFAGNRRVDGALTP